MAPLANANVVGISIMIYSAEVVFAAFFDNCWRSKLKPFSNYLHPRKTSFEVLSTGFQMIYSKSYLCYF